MGVELVVMALYIQQLEAVLAFQAFPLGLGMVPFQSHFVARRKGWMRSSEGGECDMFLGLTCLKGEGVPLKMGP